ncbi:MAG TPA: hypothetical protein VD862_00825 [Candidatus Paceibacterota bacterium]|nr:hypothetical protein [Candidatus Paceibacterota bacterium]
MTQRTGFIVFFALAVVIVTAFVWPDVANRPAPAERAAIGAVAERAGDDTMFPEPVPVAWEGDVVGVMDGGQAYAVERTDDSRFYADVSMLGGDPLDGEYRFSGDWTGTTCAYRNTVFMGQCVPEMTVRSVEPLRSGENR